MRKYFYRILGCVMLLCMLMGGKAEAAEKKVDIEWKNGIVEINAGVTDSNGEFHVLKHASGFLITNSEQNTYIITTRSAVLISGEEKSNWMQENGYSEESNYGMNTAIHVVIKGDVSSAVTIVNQSENEDFVILKSESVIQEKSCFKIGSNREHHVGDTVYSLGFSDFLGENERFMYTKEDVSVQEGKLETEGSNYITHQSVMDIGELGGPVVDEDGYVIGLNQKIDEDLKVYALPIENIKDILDSYGITYGSQELDRAYERLQELWNQGTQMLQERYQKKSLTEIRNELEIAKSVLESNTKQVETVKNEINNLETVINQAVPKMAKINLMMIGSAGIILIMMVFLVVLCVKEKRLMTESLVKTSTEQFREQNWEYKKEISNQYRGSNENLQSVVRRNERDSYVHMRMAVLQRVSNGEQILLERENLTIGKSANQVDYVIQGNKTISRVHVTIRKVGEDYEIMDMNSSNGTFVNGRRISGDAIKLKDQDKVRLSDEEFIFKMI